MAVRTDLDIVNEAMKLGEIAYDDGFNTADLVFIGALIQQSAGYAIGSGAKKDE